MRGDQLYVRTIEGLKRVDALLRRLDTRFLDPLAFDSQSRIGVPGLIGPQVMALMRMARAAGLGGADSSAMMQVYESILGKSVKQG